MTNAVDWNVVSTAVAAISAIAAAVSAYFSYMTIKAGRIATTEQRAAHFMLQYVELNLKYPTFSTTKKDESYQWFVFAVLVMAREVLAAHSLDAKWNKQVKQQLAYHWEELKEWPKPEIEDFGPGVSELVAEVISSKGRI